MRIVEDKPERMVLKDRTFWISFICGPLGLFLAFVTVTQPNWGSGIGAALTLVCALVFFDSTDMVLDRVTRTIDLRRMTMGRHRRWSLAFGDIRDVQIERSSGGRNGPTYRLVFVTAGEQIPLTAALEGGGRGRYEEMQQKIQHVLGGAAAPAPPYQPHLPPPPPPAPDIVQPG
jgi:hypothetical protein